jgi:hypothetical protein
VLSVPSVVKILAFYGVDYKAKVVFNLGKSGWSGSVAGRDMHLKARGQPVLFSAENLPDAPFKEITGDGRAELLGDGDPQARTIKIFTCNLED